MNRSLETRPSLLLRIRDADDRIAWHDFVEIYAPLIHAYARTRGLQDADAADVTQDVLQAVATHAERFDYDASRGSFRGWLFRVTLNKLRDLVARRKAHAVGSGDTGVHELLVNTAAADSDEAAWDQQHAWRLFLWAAEKSRVDFREKTWQAFWRTTVEQEPVSQVASDLKLSAGAIHVARCRVVARVKELLQNVEPD
ncbi:MAG: sigma-70 family RNA polymerase sigma factor [Pirellulales bacterium]